MIILSKEEVFIQGPELQWSSLKLKMGGKLCMSISVPFQTGPNIRRVVPEALQSELKLCLHIPLFYLFLFFFFFTSFFFSCIFYLYFFLNYFLLTISNLFFSLMISSNS